MRSIGRKHWLTQQGSAETHGIFDDYFSPIQYPVLMYKCLHRSASSYLINKLCQVTDVKAHQQLHSSSSSPLIISCT